ncbi:MAG: hypothetical protein PHU71_00125 [Candidatus Gracilibacteria bacterium]|nr:hypothetical protein [Candidatus Gracilibacteria bacterium]
MSEKIEVILEGDPDSLRTQIKKLVKFVLLESKLVLFHTSRDHDQVTKNHSIEENCRDFIGAGKLKLREHKGIRYVWAEWQSLTCMRAFGKEKPRENAEEWLEKVRQKVLEVF